jgi:hypothetical protein
MSEIEEIKSRLALILNEQFEIKDYKINDNQDIEIMIRLPEESFDVYIYTNLDRNKYFETSYYCNFHNNKREFENKNRKLTIRNKCVFLYYQKSYKNNFF